MLGLDKPKILEEVSSKYSGKMQVIKGYGTKYVVTGQWTQSGGVIRDVWLPVLKSVGRKEKSWLILGLATGTVARLISQKYKPTKIVGVEIDPEMIRIGKQYFDLEKISNLEIIIQSAEQLDTKDHFDFILVDMYSGDKLPDFVYTKKYLEKLKKIGVTVVFNHLFHEAWMKENAQKLVDQAKLIWPSVRLIRVLTNLMIICG
jgi:spermidine synthase